MTYAVTGHRCLGRLGVANYESSKPEGACSCQIDELASHSRLVLMQDLWILGDLADVITLCEAHSIAFSFASGNLVSVTGP